MKKLWIGIACVVIAAGTVDATAGPFDTYVSGATAVVKSANQQPVLDQGGVVCLKSGPAPSLGGGCVLFGPWDSILVQDKLAGRAVAFQVCIDNNGDSVCSGGERDECSDDLFFSHDDAGNFFNPLGPLPKGFRFGCPGGPWPGYVVFLCEGAHIAGGPAGGGVPHAHAATTGSITGTLGGTGFGNFCSPPQSAPPKPYLVE